MNQYPKSYASFERLLNLMANYIGETNADDFTSKSLDELHDRMEKGCLSIKIARDMETLTEN